MATLNLRVTVSDTKATLVRDLVTGQTLTGRERLMNRLLNLLQAMSSGDRGMAAMVLNVVDPASTAKGTITVATAIATNTVTINGVVFTAVASGATANQFNVGTDAVTATNLAASINASVTALVAGVVSAAAVGTVVTISAIQGGSLGNIITLASSGSTVNPSGARFTGGVDSQVSLTY